MISIKKLKRPNKRSGNLLAVGQTTMIRGMAITNVKAGEGVYVDKFTPKKPRKKK